MAQTGNSCSNPYVMNLTNGAGNAEFQFHYPDTMMYVKLVGLNNKQNFYFNIDTTSSLVIKRITIKKIDNLANNIYDSEVASLNYNLSLNNIYFTNIDSALLLIKKESFSNSCNYCDTSNLKFGISIIQQILPDCNGDPRYCDNLVRNGNLEQFAPQFFQNNPNENMPPYTGTFVFPHWGHLGMDESATCGWNYEWYDQGPGSNPQFMEVSPTYVNSWFDEPSTYTACNANIPVNEISQCNYLAGYGLTAAICNIQPQQINDFFPSSLGYTNEGYVRSSSNVPSRIMRGQIDPPLQQNKKYYLEVNIGAPNTGTFGGLIDIDVSSSLNYDQASYQGGPQPANVEIQLNGFDYDQNNLWRKFNTIFTSSGNESRIYAGNLSHNTFAQFPSANPIGSYCYNTGSGTYFFDNFVVKEFFADAGNPTIACEGAPVQIGGNSCPFPNAVYNWQPAAYFVDNTFQNPTFILPLGSGLSNVTCTLTVTIPMADGTFATTDPSYVNITIIQGSSITLSGTTTVLPNGIATLNANGGSNYVWTGSDGTSFTGASINVGPLTQDVTYTVNALSNSGCSVTEIITVIVTPLPAACISDPNYPNTIIIPDGTVDATFLAMNLGVYVSSVYVVTSKNFALAGTLNFSSAMNVKFENCHFFCYDASEIINYGMLDLHRSRFEACQNMWKGIQNNFGIKVESCNFKDAEYAIHLKHKSRYKITWSTFENNLFGIFMGEPNVLSAITGYDYKNKFTNPLPLKFAYASMLNWKPRSESGIRIESMKYPLQIGLEIANAVPLSYTNTFHNINNGIYIVNSDVKVVNSMFFSIIPTPQNQIPVNPSLRYAGVAIYAQSTGLNKKLTVNPIVGFTGNEFTNCTEGIKTNKVSLNAVGLKMNNMGSGILCYNSTMCIHDVCSNKINAFLRGIEISGAGFANSINVNSNIINISFSGAIAGISVTATQLGLVGNVNIKFNEVTAVSTAQNGIMASKLASPILLCNTVKRVNNNISSNIALNGYNISGCNGANLTTNHMEWAGATSSANTGNDYVVTSSPASELVCNVSGVSNVGFKISSNCLDLTFRRNKIGSHAIGLYYDGTANSGSQPANASITTEGNKWLGSYSTWGAKNMALPPDVNNSLYYYHPSQTTINRPPNNSWFPSNWFDFSITTLIQPDCTTGACILNQIAKPGNTDYYRAIANGSITTVDYPAQNKWMAQSYLINLLGNDSILRNNDDSLQYFYYAPESRTLRTIREIDARNNNYAATSKLFSQSVYANDSLLTILSQNMSLQLSDTLMPDSVFYNLSADLQAQYAFVNDINEGFSNDIFELLSENLNQAKEINDTLQSTNANETILQTINDIYYRFHQSKYLKINEEDSSMISYIAHLCPLAAGPAVFQARDLYTLLADSIVYDDSVKCAMQGYTREELQVFEPKGAIQKIASTYFKAYPVPSNEAVELQFSELNSEAKLTVFNIQGQLIYQTTIPKGLSRFNLDIKPYSEGVYQVLLLNSELSKRSKICKIK